MKSKIGTLIVIVFLLIGIGGMIYFNYTLFKPTDDMQEILLGDETPTSQKTVTEGEEVDNSEPQPTVQQPKIIYENDFSQANTLAEFQTEDTGDKDKPGKWEISNGKLLQSGSIWGGTYGKPIAGKQFLGTSAILKNKSFTNFDLQVTMNNKDNDGMGILFRHDGNNYYRVLAVKDPNNGGPFLMLDKQLLKNNKSNFVALKTKEWEFEQEKDYTFKIQVNESKIKVWINDTLMFDTVDTSITSGTIGFHSYGSAGLSFKSLKVGEINSLTSPSAQSESEAPSNIINPDEPSTELEANTHMEKVQGTIESKTGNTLLVKTSTTSKSQKIQLIDGTDIRKNSTTGVKAELSELLNGKEVEVSGGLYQTKLNEEPLFIAERIILKSF